MKNFLQKYEEDMHDYISIYTYTPQRHWKHYCLGTAWASNYVQ
jgi:hypothetical protein